MSTTFAYSLLHNGLDFLLSSVRSLAGTPTPSDAKYAILHLSSGVELLLKERLRREHWALVIAQVDTANREAYEAGDFVSTAFAQCVTRLERICAIKLSKDQHAALKRLKSLRNRIEHFTVRQEVAAMRTIAAKALHALLTFVDTELDPTRFDAAERTVLHEIQQCLSRIDEFVKQRWDEIAEAVESAQPVVATCDSCGQTAVTTHDGQAKCLFCAATTSCEIAADAYIESDMGLSGYRVAKEGGEWPKFACPECGADALVDRGGSGDAEPHEQYLCWGCGEAWPEGDLRRCVECNEPFASAGRDDIICDSCFGARLTRE